MSAEALVAEAVAKAEDDLGLRSSYVNNAEHPPVHFVGRDSSATHVRLDIHDAALRHLAERVEKAEAALGRIVREHWIEVAKKEVRSMEYDHERLYMSPQKPYGRIDRSALAQQKRLRKMADDERNRKELPRLIAQTKAAIAAAEDEAKGVDRG